MRLSWGSEGVQRVRGCVDERVRGCEDVRDEGTKEDWNGGERGSPGPRLSSVVYQGENKLYNQ